MSIYIGDRVKMRLGSGLEVTGRLRVKTFGDVCVVDKTGFSYHVSRDSKISLIEEGPHHGNGRTLEDYRDGQWL